MPCESCVDKLALKLVKHHKNLDLIRAFELAEKGIGRVESRGIKTPLVKSGNPTDYTQSCVSSGSCTCKAAGTTCSSSPQCLSASYTCACSCPDPLPNSHYVSDDCLITSGGCVCNPVLHTCIAGTCVCGCSPATHCYYDCDPPYVWNPITLQCELPPTGQQLFTLINQEDY